MSRRKKIIGIFGVYCALMMFLLFFRQRPGEGTYWQRVMGLLNPVPFETITRYIRLLGHSRARIACNAVVNLAGNVILFLPLGGFLPALFPKLNRWWKVLLTGAGIIAVVELTQMFTLLGTCDVDDLILNVLGIWLGVAVFWLLKNRRTS